MARLEVTIDIRAEGPPGCGKSKEIRKLKQILTAIGYSVRGGVISMPQEEHRLVLTREDRDERLERT